MVALFEVDDRDDLRGWVALAGAIVVSSRRLAALEPRTLALMHGPAFAGDGAAALLGLADAYEARLAAGMPSAAGAPSEVPA